MDKQLVNIIGISPRSGTNFLKEIICSHPNCVMGNIGGEDYLLYHAHRLTDFVQQVQARWKPSWNNSGARLKEHLVNGIYQFIVENTQAEATHIVCKTPITKNLNRYKEVFPKGKLLVVIRDGRDVLDSAMETFKNRNIFQNISVWRKGARDILSLKANHGDLEFCIVRYEDLIEKAQNETERICAFLGLPIASFPFHLLKELPVKGSSQIKNSEGKVSWKLSDSPSQSESGLNFTQKYKHWGFWKKWLFEIMAGKENKALGYE